MGTRCPTDMSMEEFIPVLTLQGPGCAYVMYSLSREYIVPPLKLGHNNDVLCSAHEDLMASFRHLSKETRSLNLLTNALRIFNHNLCLVWSWIFVQERELEVELTMINMPYLQTFITTQLLHLEQSLTQQRSVGWIRVSKAADVNIYYNPPQASLC